jgi:hypothetical protein
MAADLRERLAAPDGPNIPPPIDTELAGYAGQLKMAQNFMEKPAAQLPMKKPVVDWIKKQGGVSVDSQLAQDLRAMDVTPKSVHRGCSKKQKEGGPKVGGGEFDNVTAREFNDQFDTTALEDGNGYVDRAWLIEKIREETFGKNTRSDSANAKWVDDFMQQLAPAWRERHQGRDAGNGARRAGRRP